MHLPPDAVLKPMGDEASPIYFKVDLRSYGGAKIDPDSVRVTYLKTPLVNLTPRLRRYITEQAILMPNAEVAPGEHKLRIEMKDNKGYVGTTTITLIIQR